VIRYQRRCSRGHGFEGWFKNSDAYARDVADLDCPICGDRTIDKAIMAPAVLQRVDGAGRGDTGAPSVAAPSSKAVTSASAGPGLPAKAALPVPAEGTAPVAAVPAVPVGPEQEQLAKALILMRKLRAHVEANFEHVGDRFAEEARKIHYEETEPRGIYGEASREEVERLEDEGIAIAPLPNLPKLDG
jgi:hypothetical protein